MKTTPECPPTAKNRRKPTLHITLSNQVRDMMTALRELLGYTYDTELLAALVREEWERRNGRVMFGAALLNDASSTSVPSPASGSEPAPPKCNHGTTDTGGGETAIPRSHGSSQTTSYPRLKQRRAGDKV